MSLHPSTVCKTCSCTFFSFLIQIFKCFTDVYLLNLRTLSSLCFNYRFSVFFVTGKKLQTGKEVIQIWEKHQLSDRLWYLNLNAANTTQSCAKQVLGIIHKCRLTPVYWEHRHTPQSNTPLLSETICYSLHISKHPPLSCVTHRWQPYQGVIAQLSPMRGVGWMMLTSFLKAEKKSSQVTIRFHFSFWEYAFWCSEEGSPY